MIPILRTGVPTDSRTEKANNEASPSGEELPEDASLQGDFDSPTQGQGPLRDDKSLNAQDKPCSFWGGNMVQSVRACDGNMSKFSDDCLGVHGLYYAFYSGNGWLRTVSYLVVWCAFGVFFFYLTVPLVQDYRNKTVSTSIDTETGVTDGLPLPVITVCPHGSGIRCDCLLWRKLYCRYSNDVLNTTWRQRFTAYGCISNLEYITDSIDPQWIEPMCEDFLQGGIEPVDTCGPTKEDMEAFPGLSAFTMDAVYNRITSRENQPDGPFITVAELLFYSPVRLEEKVFFLKEGRRSGLPGPVPQHWVKPVYLELGSFKYCSQVRPPPEEERQYSAGADNGLSVIVTHVTDKDYPIINAGDSAAAVDIHVGIIHPSQHNDAYVPVETSTYDPFAAGTIATVDYKLETFSRQKGWGPRSSRDCEHTSVPRALCVQNKVLDIAADVCGCPAADFQDKVDNAVLSGIYTCSSSFGTTQWDCTSDFFHGSTRGSRVSLSMCPIQCETRTREIIQSTSIPLSDGQIRFVTNYLNSIGANSTNVTKEETVYARFGAGTMLIKHYEEAPKTSFAALMGQIGGNAGLWCGLSFVLMFEVLEFCTVFGVYAWRKRWGKTR